MTILNTPVLEKVVPVTISPDEIAIAPQVIIENLGYRGIEPPEFVLQSIQEELAAMPALLEISCGYTILPLTRMDEKSIIEIGNSRFTTGKIISAQLNRAQYGALFICTIGNGMEERAKSLINDGDTFVGTVVDFIASEAADTAVNVLADKLMQAMSAYDLGVTYPFSPGYCGWPLAEQPMLFSYFPERPFGVTLKESHLMLPMKSVSGVIGIGADAHRRVYPCKICTFKDCYKNRS